MPALGTMPIGEIEPAHVLGGIRKIEGKGNLESARRTLQLASAVLRYAVATARLASDPTRDLRGALTPRLPSPIARHSTELATPYTSYRQPPMRLIMRPHPSLSTTSAASK